MRALLILLPMLMTTAGANALPLPTAPTAIEPHSENASGQTHDLKLARDAYDRMTVAVRVGDSGPYRFLVDTGASFISMSSGEAKRLGLKYLEGEKASISTANGVVRSYKVKLDEVRLGDVTLNNVDGMVHADDSLPIILLGMSFLNRMEMTRDGEQMVLKKRF